jgi:hypothetical protein
MERKKKIGIILVIALVFLVVFIQFFVLTPQKPYIPKPDFKDGDEIQSQHIEWLVNELGSYQLSNSAEMEMIVDNKTFSIKVSNRFPKALLGNAADPDIRIRGDYASFSQIFLSSDIQGEVNKLYNEGKVQVELIKDLGTLVLKGYKGIYDQIQG